MTDCFAYIRVSTAKQGEKGVSLQEQRLAIENYASRFGLDIITWFEERESASKQGRQTFTRMMKLLRRGAVKGVIIHKIDRSARNLRDWSDIKDLNDAGISVHFANEDIDLNSRGGRLSADIQAVVSADYIYNLREETKKGIYGRLKQGLLPMCAPLGYLDTGPGKRKEIDPVRGPLIREAFQHYASGQYSLRTLVEHLYSRGLRSRTGKKVGVNSLSLIFHNPFYMGIIRIKRNGLTFEGVHEPLVPPWVFNRVQSQIRGKTQTVTRTYDFLFRRLLTCGNCKNKFIGELQKGHVYYRCHTDGCPGGCVRERAIEERITSLFDSLAFRGEERTAFEEYLRTATKHLYEETQSSRQSLALRLDQASQRLARLTDAFLDQTIELDLFEERKTALLIEKKEIEEKLRLTSRERCNAGESLKKFLELADRASLSYSVAETAEKRNLIELLTSNRDIYEKTIDIRLSPAFSLLAERATVLTGWPIRRTTRSEGDLPCEANPFSELIARILKWLDDTNKPNMFA